MAKNKSRKNKPQDQAKPKTDNVSPASVTEDAGEAAKTAAASQDSRKSAKKKDPFYQVVSKRDSGVLLAYITFNYRVFHPGVSARLIIYGLLLVAPGIFFFKDLYWKIFFTGIGLALILLGFFRQYLSLWMTKKNDPDYKAGSEFTYNFYETDAEFLKDGVRFSRLSKYKDITNFYYDDDYYYLAVLGRDFYVIPKSAFTIGDAAEFEEFIYRKSKHTCRWIPVRFSDKMKKRRAERTIASAGRMLK